MDLNFLAAMAFCFPLILNLVFTPLIIRIADKYQIFDRLNHRKIHTGNISRLGGIGFFLAFTVSFLLVMAVSEPVVVLDARFLFPLGGALLMFGIGLWDDFYELRARLKLIVQLVASAAVLIGGFWFNSLSVPGMQVQVTIGVIGMIMSFGWMLGITNAVNLIDGMDGLAGGAGFVASLAYGVLSYLSGRVVPSLLALCLAGALLGFLAFNRPKAKIFMGDGGAYFLGFMLALIPLIDAFPQGAIMGNHGSFPDGRVNVLYAITLLLIPIADTLAAFIRRARKGQHLFEPDRFHMHHKMLGMGLSSTQVLLIVTGIELLLAGVVLFDALAGSMVSAVCLAVSWLLVIGFFIYLDRVQYRNQIPDNPE